MQEDIFYTLTGYSNKEKRILTHAMEDYLEMIYRLSLQKKQIHVKDLSESLHVQPSSVTKMMIRLKNLGLASFEKYGILHLTQDGMIYGKYLLYRHDVLVTFFKMINQDDYQLEQVEKIEHFIDYTTIQNMERILNSSTKKKTFRSYLG